MNIAPDILKQIIVRSGLVPEAAFDDAAQTAKDIGKSIEDILVFRGFLNSTIYSKLIADYLHVGWLDMKHVAITDEALSLIPQNLAKTYKMVPLGLDAEKLKLAMSDPTDVEALEFAKRFTGREIVPFYVSPEDFSRALSQYKRNFENEFQKVMTDNVSKTEKSGDIKKASEDLPVIKILDTFMEYAVAERASDMHIETQEQDVIIRFRIDGDLRDIIRLPQKVQEPLIARVKILSNLKLDERRIPQDGRYKVTVNDEVIALRVSIIPGFYGENIVMRLLRESARPSSLEELGLMGRNLELVNRAIEAPNGMILVTGPTGSGKTTTLYSLLTILNTIDVKICTIEDPVEYGVNRVTQIQVNAKAGLDFAAGLRALLRHDPDIMMVGEIRDKETAEIAVHSALTGHLVLSTLHTNDAVGALPRLLDMGVEGYLAASTLNIVIAQRLVRKICSVCIKEYTPDAAVLAKLVDEVHIDPTRQKFYRGMGCSECHGKGFLGRIGIYEVLSVTEKIRSLVVRKVGSDDLLKAAKEEGMISMMQDGLNKVSSGFTTIEQVLQAVTDN